MYKKKKHKKHGYIVEITEQNPESESEDKTCIRRIHVEDNKAAEKHKPKNKKWSK